MTSFGFLEQHFENCIIWALADGAAVLQGELCKGFFTSIGPESSLPVALPEKLEHAKRLTMVRQPCATI